MKRSLQIALFMMFETVGLSVAASRAGAVTVSVDPPDTTVMIHSEFAVRVVTDAFPNLKAFELIFSFDPSKIQFLGVDPGEVLTTSGNQFQTFVLNDYVAPPDTAWYDAAMLDGKTAGPGILAFFKFKALTTGASPIHCELVDYRDSDDVPTFPTCQSGAVTVTDVTAARGMTWGRLKTIYR